MGIPETVHDSWEQSYPATVFSPVAMRVRNELNARHECVCIDSLYCLAESWMKERMIY